jgi:hypothetical protein
MIANNKLNGIDKMDVFSRFPANGESGEQQADQRNPAIRLYGRRFYKDQTPVEYLAEFLLVFASPKQQDGEGAYQAQWERSGNLRPFGIKSLS